MIIPSVAGSGTIAPCDPSAAGSSNLRNRSSAAAAAGVGEPVRAGLCASAPPATRVVSRKAHASNGMRLMILLRGRIFPVRPPRSGAAQSVGHRSARGIPDGPGRSETPDRASVETMNPPVAVLRGVCRSDQRDAQRPSLHIWNSDPRESNRRDINRRLFFNARTILMRPSAQSPGFPIENR